MQIQFKNAPERLEFCITFMNVKRMYHEIYSRNQLYREYRHDVHHAAVTWLITEVLFRNKIDYRSQLRGQYPID